jgi:hypothetical protein
MAQAPAPAADTAEPAQHIHKASNGHAMHMKAKNPAKKGGTAKPAATTAAAKS